MCTVYSIFTTQELKYRFYIFNFWTQFRFKESVKDKLEDLETKVGKEYDKVICHFLYFFKC